MNTLNWVADRQTGWSTAANNFRVGIDRARWAVFVFSVLGALLATLASQFGPAVGAPPTAAASANDLRTWLALTGALSLATATFFV